MPFFNGWPWANFQEQNLDWIINQIKKIWKFLDEDLRDIVRQYIADVSITQTYDSNNKRVIIKWEA